MYKYKTKDGSDCVVAGIGETKDGFITSEVKIESPNLELVSGGDEPSANHVQGVVPQAAQGSSEPVAPATPAEPTNKESE